jgi:plasmid maintenance system antidote protein VapI
MFIFILTYVDSKHNINAMINRKQITRILGITEAYFSMLLTGKRKVSWPLSERLAKLFPARTIHQWHNATADDIKRAFSEIKYKKIKKG